MYAIMNVITSWSNEIHGMTDQEQSDREKHWRELAEQLGLPAEPEGSSHTAPPAPRTGANRRLSGTSSQSRERPEVAAMTSLAAATGPQATWGKKTPVRHRPKTFIRPFRKNAGPNENRVEKRRLQNVKKSRPYLLASHPTPPLRASSPARRRRAIRGAARCEGADAGDLKVSRPAPLAGPWARQADASDSTEDAAGTETDDMDNITDWNVPSWTELIDSLYRPER